MLKVTQGNGEQSKNADADNLAKILFSTGVPELNILGPFVQEYFIILRSCCGVRVSSLVFRFSYNFYISLPVKVTLPFSSAINMLTSDRHLSNLLFILLWI